MSAYRWNNRFNPPLQTAVPLHPRNVGATLPTIPANTTAQQYPGAPYSAVYPNPITQVPAIAITNISTNTEQLSIIATLSFGYLNQMKATDHFEFTFTNSNTNVSTVKSFQPAGTQMYTIGEFDPGTNYFVYVTPVINGLFTASSTTLSFLSSPVTNPGNLEGVIITGSESYAIIQFAGVYPTVPKPDFIAVNDNYGNPQILVPVTLSGTQYQPFTIGPYTNGSSYVFAIAPVTVSPGGIYKYGNVTAVPTGGNIFIPGPPSTPWITSPTTINRLVTLTLNPDTNEHPVPDYYEVSLYSSTLKQTISGLWISSAPAGLYDSTPSLNNFYGFTVNTAYLDASSFSTISSALNTSIVVADITKNDTQRWFSFEITDISVFVYNSYTNLYGFSNTHLVRDISTINGSDSSPMRANFNTVSLGSTIATFSSAIVSNFPTTLTSNGITATFSLSGTTPTITLSGVPTTSYTTVAVQTFANRVFSPKADTLTVWAGYPSSPISVQQKTGNQTIVWNISYNSNAGPRPNYYRFSNVTTGFSVSTTLLTQTFSGLVNNQSYNLTVEGYANGAYGIPTGTTLVPSVGIAVFGGFNRFINRDISFTLYQPPGGALGYTIIGVNSTSPYDTYSINISAEVNPTMIVALSTPNSGAYNFKIYSKDLVNQQYNSALSSEPFGAITGPPFQPTNLLYEYLGNGTNAPNLTPTTTLSLNAAWDFGGPNYNPYFTISDNYGRSYRVDGYYVNLTLTVSSYLSYRYSITPNANNVSGTSISTPFIDLNPARPSTAQLYFSGADGLTLTLSFSGPTYDTGSVNNYYTILPLAPIGAFPVTNVLGSPFSINSGIVPGALYRLQVFTTISGITSASGTITNSITSGTPTPPYIRYGIGANQLTLTLCESPLNAVTMDSYLVTEYFSSNYLNISFAPTGNTYSISFAPTTTPSAGTLTLSSQVTTSYSISASPGQWYEISGGTAGFGFIQNSGTPLTNPLANGTYSNLTSLTITQNSSSITFPITTFSSQTVNGATAIQYTSPLIQKNSLMFGSGTQFSTNVFIQSASASFTWTSGNGPFRGGTYRYDAQATGQGGIISSVSTTGPVYNFISPPQTPLSVVNNLSVTVTFSPGITSIPISYYAVTDNFGRTVSGATTLSSYVFGNCTNGSSYTYSIVAYSSTLSSYPSTISNIYVGRPGPPILIPSIQFNSGTSSCTLSTNVFIGTALIPYIPVVDICLTVKTSPGNTYTVTRTNTLSAGSLYTGQGPTFQITNITLGGLYVFSVSAYASQLYSGIDSSFTHIFGSYPPNIPNGPFLQINNQTAFVSVSASYTNQFSPLPNVYSFYASNITSGEIRAIDVSGVSTASTYTVIFNELIINNNYRFGGYTITNGISAGSAWSDINTWNIGGPRTINSVKINICGGQPVTTATTNVDVSLDTFYTDTAYYATLSTGIVTSIPTTTTVRATPSSLVASTPHGNMFGPVSLSSYMINGYVASLTLSTEIVTLTNAPTGRLSFTAPGTYTYTIQNTGTINVSISGSGGAGGISASPNVTIPSNPNVPGGRTYIDVWTGAAGGYVSYQLLNVSAGDTIELVVGAGGVATSSYVTDSKYGGAGGNVSRMTLYSAYGVEKFTTFAGGGGGGLGAGGIANESFSRYMGYAQDSIYFNGRDATGGNGSGTGGQFIVTFCQGVYAPYIVPAQVGTYGSGIGIAGGGGSGGAGRAGSSQPATSGQNGSIAITSSYPGGVVLYSGDIYRATYNTYSTSGFTIITGPSHVLTISSGNVYYASVFGLKNNSISPIITSLSLIVLPDPPTNPQLVLIPPSILSPVSNVTQISAVVSWAPAQTSGVLYPYSINNIVNYSPISSTSKTITVSYGTTSFVSVYSSINGLSSTSVTSSSVNVFTNPPLNVTLSRYFTTITFSWSYAFQTGFQSNLIFTASATVNPSVGGITITPGITPNVSMGCNVLTPTIYSTISSAVSAGIPIRMTLTGIDVSSYVQSFQISVLSSNPSGYNFQSLTTPGLPQYTGSSLSASITNPSALPTGGYTVRDINGVAIFGTNILSNNCTFTGVSGQNYNIAVQANNKNLYSQVSGSTVFSLNVNPIFPLTVTYRGTSISMSWTTPQQSDGTVPDTTTNPNYVWLIKDQTGSTLAQSTSGTNILSYSRTGQLGTTYNFSIVTSYYGFVQTTSGNQIRLATNPPTSVVLTGSGLGIIVNWQTALQQSYSPYTPNTPTNVPPNDGYSIVDLCGNYVGTALAASTSTSVFIPVSTYSYFNFAVTAIHNGISSVAVTASSGFFIGVNPVSSLTASVNGLIATLTWSLPTQFNSDISLELYDASGNTFGNPFTQGLYTITCNTPGLCAFQTIVSETILITACGAGGTGTNARGGYATSLYTGRGTNIPAGTIIIGNVGSRGIGGSGGGNTSVIVPYQVSPQGVGYYRALDAGGGGGTTVSGGGFGTDGGSPPGQPGNGSGIAEGGFTVFGGGSSPGVNGSITIQYTTQPPVYSFLMSNATTSISFLISPGRGYNFRIVSSRGGLVSYTDARLTTFIPPAVGPLQTSFIGLTLNNQWTIPSSPIGYVLTNNTTGTYNIIPTGNTTFWTFTEQATKNTFYTFTLYGLSNGVPSSTSITSGLLQVFSPTPSNFRITNNNTTILFTASSSGSFQNQVFTLTDNLDQLLESGLQAGSGNSVQILPLVGVPGTTYTFKLYCITGGLSSTPATNTYTLTIPGSIGLGRLPNLGTLNGAFYPLTVYQCTPSADSFTVIPTDLIGRIYNKPPVRNWISADITSNGCNAIVASTDTSGNSIYYGKYINVATGLEWALQTIPALSNFSVSNVALSTKSTWAGAVTTCGLWITSNIGVTGWTQIQNSIQYKFTTLGFSPDGSTVVLGSANQANNQGYLYTVDISTIFTNPQYFTNADTTIITWKSVRWSGNGSVVFANGSSGLIYYSLDRGNSWLGITGTSDTWTNIAVNNTGTVLVGAGLSNSGSPRIFSGTIGNWTSRVISTTAGLPNGGGSNYFMASSYNGDIILAASTKASVIYASYDSGNSWYVDPRFTTGAGGALQVAALSANGYVQLGVGSNSGIQTLINTPQTTGAPPITLTLASLSQASVSTTVPLGTTGYSIIPYLRNIQGPETFIWTSLTSGPRLWSQNTALFANIVRTSTSSYASGVLQFSPVTTQQNTQLCMLILSDLCSSANTTNLLDSNLSFPVGAGSPTKSTSYYPPGNPEIQGFLYYSSYSGNYDLNPGLYVFTYCNSGASSIQRTPINISVPALPVTNLKAVSSSLGQNIILSWSQANLYNLYEGYLTYDIYSNGSLLTNVSSAFYTLPNIGESVQFDVITVAGSFLSVSTTITINPPTGPSYINVSGLASTNRITLEWDPTTTLPPGTAYTYNIFSNGIFVSNTGSTVANTSFGLVPTTAANAASVGKFFSVTLVETGGYQSAFATTMSSAQIINDNKNTTSAGGTFTFTIPSSFIITDMIVIGQGGVTGTGGEIKSPTNNSPAQTIHYGAPAAGGQGGYISYSNGKGPIYRAGAQVTISADNGYYNPGQKDQLILSFWYQYTGTGRYSISGGYYYVYQRDYGARKARMSLLKIDDQVIAAAGGGGSGGNTPGNDGTNNVINESLYPVIADGMDGEGSLYGINGTGGAGGGSMVFQSSNVLKYPSAINSQNMAYFLFDAGYKPPGLDPPYKYWLPFGRGGTGGKFVNLVTLCGGTYTTGNGADGQTISFDSPYGAAYVPCPNRPDFALTFSPAGKTTSGILSQYGYGGGMSSSFNQYANIPYSLYPGNGFVSISYAYVLLK